MNMREERVHLFLSDEYVWYSRLEEREPCLMLWYKVLPVWWLAFWKMLAPFHQSEAGEGRPQLKGKERLMVRNYRRHCWVWEHHSPVDSKHPGAIYSYILTILTHYLGHCRKGMWEYTYTTPLKGVWHEIFSLKFFLLNWLRLIAGVVETGDSHSRISPRIFEKNANSQNGILRAPGTLIHEKNLVSHSL